MQTSQSILVEAADAVEIVAVAVEGTPEEEEAVAAGAEEIVEAAINLPAKIQEEETGGHFAAGDHVLLQGS